MDKCTDILLKRLKTRLVLCFAIMQHIQQFIVTLCGTVITSCIVAGFY